MGSSNKQMGFPLEDAQRILKNILLARIVRLNSATLSGSKRKAAFLLAQLEKVDNLRTQDDFIAFLTQLKQNDIVNESSGLRGFYKKPISTTKKDIDFFLEIIKKEENNLNLCFVYADLSQIPERGSFFEDQYTEKARDVINTNLHRLKLSEGKSVIQELRTNTDVVNSQFHSRVEKSYTQAFAAFNEQEFKKQQNSLKYYYAEFDERPNPDLKQHLLAYLDAEMKRLQDDITTKPRLDKLIKAKNEIIQESKTNRLLSIVQKTIDDPDIKARRGWRENNTVRALKELVEKVKNGKPLESRPRGNIPRTP